MFNPRVRACALAVALIAISVTGALAQAPAPEPRTAAPGPVRVNTDGTVSVKAQGVPLEGVLAAMNPVCALDVRLEPAIAAHPVTIDTEPLPPALAVAEILKASGLNFAMHTRCGTPARPMMVVALDEHGVPIVPRLNKENADDPSLKAAVLPPLPPGPTPEPEKHDDQTSPAGGTLGRAAAPSQELAPGQLTDAQLLEALTPPSGAKPAVVELPFADETGQPLVVIRPSTPSSVVTLPFPDANGRPIEVAVPPGPRAPAVNFPVVNPDAKAASDPATKPTPGPVNPADAKPKGGGR
jgi:hypothetical protein